MNIIQITKSGIIYHNGVKVEQAAVEFASQQAAYYQTHPSEGALILAETADLIDELR